MKKAVAHLIPYIEEEKRLNGGDEQSNAGRELNDNLWCIAILSRVVLFCDVFKEYSVVHHVFLPFWCGVVSCAISCYIVFSFYIVLCCFEEHCVVMWNMTFYC